MSTFTTPIKAFPTKRLDASKHDLRLNQDQSRLQFQINEKTNQHNQLRQQEQHNQPQHQPQHDHSQHYQNPTNAPTALPEISAIEKRLVNKELETKRILINFILFLVLRLLNKILTVVAQKTEFLSQILANYGQLHSIIYKLLQALFFWNIGHGLYRLFKSQDDFKDLNLTNHQRSLLGLPQLEMTKLQPITSNSQTVLLSPSKNTTKTVSLSQQPQQEQSKDSFSKINKVNKLINSPHKTPIASPMSSPSPLKKSLSPKKPAGPLKKSALASKPILKVSENINTPTYIPSPKYYYRMDSPSRSKRI